MRIHLMVLTAVACLPLACSDGGCGGGGSAATEAGAGSAALTASAPAPVSSTASSTGRHRMMVRAGGAVGSLFRAASQLDLKEEQRTRIEKIATDLREADRAGGEGDAGGVRKELRAIHDEMVAGAKAGKVDAAKLEPHFSVLEKEAKERHARDVDALGKLHAVLEPAQRTSVAATVKKSEDDRAGRMKAQETALAARVADGGMTATRRRYESWVRELSLDDEQKKKLEAFIPKDDPKAQLEQREDGKKRSDATIAAFEKETFDANAPPPPDGSRIRRPYDEQVKFFNQLIPILKPEQKDKLVQRLERQSTGTFDHGRRRGGGPDEHDPDPDDREERDPR
ncbi:MAG: Spy/CpxP family protein refolding chaperone [Labilithrix sp.]|nr:Spy/CpxP family protein refolding chaperone [Labilithrix sp.]MCW5813418.1 Spy/CpxP family protein refolding chaperone [Labilithrix sp.]